MKTYQVTQHNEWCCPGMLVMVNSHNKIVGIQQNPENGATYSEPEDEDKDWGEFNPQDYKEVKEV